jgi:hypothetical protein
MARIETHLYDHQLVALNGLLEKLLIGHYESESNTLIDAAEGDEDLAGDMLTSICHVHAAARRAMRERGFIEPMATLPPVCKVAA